MHESNKMSFRWCFILYLMTLKEAQFFDCPSSFFGYLLIMDMIWNVNIFLPGTAVMWVDEMSCRKGVWKFDTLWEHPLGKGEATCHSSLCTSYAQRIRGRLLQEVLEEVENTLLIAEGILYVTILCHNILLVFGLIISDIMMMSVISVDQWLWYMDQFYILFWIRLESGTAYCLNWRYLHWFDIEIISCVHDTPGHGVLWSSFSPSDENTTRNSWRRV